MEKQIFVFGSNLAGRHGAGAALHARQHCGAIHGQGVGLQGDSYAIPTKDAQIVTLPLSEIYAHARDFIKFARANPDLQFLMTPIGTGLAGYRHDDIAPMFAGAPSNVLLPAEWVGLCEAERSRQLAEIAPEPDAIIRNLLASLNDILPLAGGPLSSENARVSAMEQRDTPIKDRVEAAIRAGDAAQAYLAAADR